MKKKEKRIQLILISIGLLLFISTYLFYPGLKKKMLLEDKLVETIPENETEKENTTSFENIEYKGLYDLNKPFIVKSKDAYILNEEPNIVYMKNMEVTLYLADGQIVTIVSSKGRYNKENYNCYFEKDVVATDGDTKITSDNLDLLATENFVEIYNNVNLDYKTGYLLADKIDYDFETKNFKVSMFEDKNIKMKVIR